PIPPPSLLDHLNDPPPHGGDLLAAWFRGEMGLGTARIPSMRTLVERVGVDIYWVTPEDLDPVIDGASTNTPRPSILVNLVEGPHCWWRTRMTLGHELCHLLADASNGGNQRFALLSPHNMVRSDHPRCNLFDGFDRIERRASAFSACLLAPDEAVRDIVGNGDPTSEIAIADIGREFGLGRTTAINRLCHVFRLSRQIRESMQQRSAQHWTKTEHSDWAPDTLGLRSGILTELACLAFADGHINALRAREFLRLPLTEPLPAHSRLKVEQRAPLRRVEDKIRLIALTYLQQKYADFWDLWDIGVEMVAPVPGGWKAQIAYRSAGKTEPYKPSGHVIISYDLTAVTDEEDFGLAEFVNATKRAAQIG
ncbi:MAG TPA: ImmA/IrrE family metallo-endopeptidase, partial [Polyangium sp.]|nr:ImmA/IrrE family metallo-endopeptidase [Polyangium sp.]